MIRIAIIGGGAAGMMCAATILEGNASNIHIDLFERNTELGKKVKISGGGRCNVTTGIEEKQEILSKYTRGSAFFKKQYGKFSVGATKKWFENHGLSLVCESDLRVFPASSEGVDVIRVFEKVFTKYSHAISIYFQRQIETIQHDAGGFILSSGIWSNTYDYLILATGGNAYAHTGSRGDGYIFARSLGHTVTQLGPSLSSLELTNHWVHTLSGLALERATLRYNGSPHLRHGPVLCTHFGISGPCVFALSSDCAFETITAKQPLTVHLIPLASWKTQDWEREIQKHCEKDGQKQFHTILGFLLPKRFIEACGREYFEDTLHKKAAEISKNERQKVAKLFGEGIPLQCIARRAGDEFVTAGGICTQELDEDNFSKIIPNFACCGEVIDVDGITGGFNLQFAWSSGWITGQALLKKIYAKD